MTRCVRPSEESAPRDFSIFISLLEKAPIPMSGSCTRLRGLRALISSCGNWRASCHATGSTSTRTRCLASSSGAGEREEGTTVGEKVEALIRRVDERWRFVEDPEDMRGVMQALRHCHVMQRVGPKNLMLRFVLAEDDVGESWVVPDVSTAYPVRERMASSRARFSSSEPARPSRTSPASVHRSSV